MSDTDSLVTLCEALQDDDERARRCMSAMRRSGRDYRFNAYLAMKRLQIEIARPIVAILNALMKGGL